MLSRRVPWMVAFTCVLLLAAGLRARGLRRASLNNDEICEVSWSSLPFAQMIAEVRRDAVHPPLDYLVQFAVGRMHGPEWSRRLPPALAGVTTIALIMILGRLWLSPAAGLMAGLLMAVTPIHIRYSQEVRPYSLPLLLLTASLLALEIHARTGRRRWAVVWASLVFLSGSTLYFAGMVAAGTGIFRIFMERKTRLRVLWRWLPLIIVVWTVLYSPWFPVLRHVAGSPPPGGPEKLDWSWWSSRLEAFATGETEPGLLSVGSWLFWAAVMVGIAAVSAWRTSMRTAVVWLLAGGALQILVLQIRPHYSDPRYLLSSLPAAYLLAGAGLAIVMRRTTWPIAASVVLLFAAYSALALGAYYRGDRSNWREITSFVRDRARAGETIVLTNEWVGRNFGYYWMTAPRPEGVSVRMFEISQDDLPGPAWIVSAQCMPRQPLLQAGLMQRWPWTEQAEVRYVRPGKRLSLRDELCPE